MAVFAATLFIAVVGFADDLRSLPVVTRLVLQASAVAAILFAAPADLRVVPALAPAELSKRLVEPLRDFALAAAGDEEVAALEPEPFEHALDLRELGWARVCEDSRRLPDFPEGVPVENGGREDPQVAVRQLHRADFAKAFSQAHYADKDERRRKN